MGMIRRSLLILAVLIAGMPLYAGGSQEPAPPAPTPTPDESPTTEAEAGAAAGRIAMDPETTEILFGLGLMPFQERIPSQNITLASLTRGDLSLEQYRGKVVFLNFWATWCPPCRAEMPSMQTLYDTLEPDGLVILAVNVLEDRDTVSAFVEEQGFTYPVMLDTDGRASMRYSVRAYPTTYLLDRAGNVLAVRPGQHEWATPEMIAGFRKLLSQP